MPGADRRAERPEEYGDDPDTNSGGYHGSGENDLPENIPVGDEADHAPADLDTYYNVGGDYWESQNPGRMSYGDEWGGESNATIEDGAPPFGMPEEVWATLDGGARAQYITAQREAERNRTVLHNLGDSIPTLDDMSVRYQGEGTTDEYGNLQGGASQLEGYGQSGDQRASMDAMRGLYESGGYTDADRNMSRALRDQQAMQMGAQNAASMQQMQARGMGGSGAELAMRMGSGDSMAGANSMADAQLQQAAMQRSWQALQGYGNSANQQQEQELQRRGALDAYNQQNMDWRRGREQRNTGYGNASRESRAQAHRDQYGYRQGLASLHLGHNPNGSQQAGANAAEAQRGLVNGVIQGTGEVIGAIV
jgi:hypothetical protein